MKKRRPTRKLAKRKLKRVEYEPLYGQPVHCLFCGKEVFGEDIGEDTEFCDHVLFIAHDEGFSYRSKRLDEMMGWAGLDEEDIIGRKSWDFDRLTDGIPIADGIKFVFHEGPPGQTGYYIGLAPT